VALHRLAAKGLTGDVRRDDTAPGTGPTGLTASPLQNPGAERVRDLDSPCGSESGRQIPISLNAALSELLERSEAKPLPNPDAIAGFLLPRLESPLAFTEHFSKVLTSPLANPDSSR